VDQGSRAQGPNETDRLQGERSGDPGGFEFGHCHVGRLRPNIQDTEPSRKCLQLCLSPHDGVGGHSSDEASESGSGSERAGGVHLATEHCVLQLSKQSSRASGGKVRQKDASTGSSKDKDTFYLDVCRPLSPLQAFVVAIASINSSVKGAQIGIAGGDTPQARRQRGGMLGMVEGMLTTRQAGNQDGNAADEQPGNPKGKRGKGAGKGKQLRRKGGMTGSTGGGSDADVEDSGDSDSTDAEEDGDAPRSGLRVGLAAARQGRKMMGSVANLAHTLVQVGKAPRQQSRPMDEEATDAGEDEIGAADKQGPRPQESRRSSIQRLAKGLTSPLQSGRKAAYRSVNRDDEDKSGESVYGTEDFGSAVEAAMLESPVGGKRSPPDGTSASNRGEHGEEVPEPSLEDHGHETACGKLADVATQWWGLMTGVLRSVTQGTMHRLAAWKSVESDHMQTVSLRILGQRGLVEFHSMHTAVRLALLLLPMAMLAELHPSGPSYQVSVMVALLFLLAYDDSFRRKQTRREKRRARELMLASQRAWEAGKNFIPADSFSGTKEGMVFTTRDRGTGYYREGPVTARTSQDVMRDPGADQPGQELEDVDLGLGDSQTQLAMEKTRDSDKGIVPGEERWGPSRSLLKLRIRAPNGVTWWSMVGIILISIVGDFAFLSGSLRRGRLGTREVRDEHTYTSMRILCAVLTAFMIFGKLVLFRVAILRSGRGQRVFMRIGREAAMFMPTTADEPTVTSSLGKEIAGRVFALSWVHGGGAFMLFVLGVVVAATDLQYLPAFSVTINNLPLADLYFVKAATLLLACLATGRSASQTACLRSCLFYRVLMRKPRWQGPGRGVRISPTVARNLVVLKAVDFVVAVWLWIGLTDQRNEIEGRGNLGAQAVYRLSLGVAAVTDLWGILLTFTVLHMMNRWMDDHPNGDRGRRGEGGSDDESSSDDGSDSGESTGESSEEGSREYGMSSDQDSDSSRDSDDDSRGGGPYSRRGRANQGGVFFSLGMTPSSTRKRRRRRNRHRSMDDPSTPLSAAESDDEENGRGSSASRRHRRRRHKLNGSAGDHPSGHVHQNDVALEELGDGYDDYFLSVGDEGSNANLQSAQGRAQSHHPMATGRQTGIPPLVQAMSPTALTTRGSGSATMRWADPGYEEAQQYQYQQEHLYLDQSRYGEAAYYNQEAYAGADQSYGAQGYGTQGYDAQGYDAQGYGEEIYGTQNYGTQSYGNEDPQSAPVSARDAVRSSHAGQGWVPAVGSMTSEEFQQLWESPAFVTSPGSSKALKSEVFAFVPISVSTITDHLWAQGFSIIASGQTGNLVKVYAFARSSAVGSSTFLLEVSFDVSRGFDPGIPILMQLTMKCDDATQLASYVKSLNFGSIVQMG